MRWDSEKDNLLSELLKDNSIEQCSIILDTTISSISNRANRLKISTIQHKYEEIKCLFCGKNMQMLKKQKRKFCSHKCSATYNNIIRPKEVRIRQAETVRKTMLNLSKNKQSIKKKIKIQKSCKVCNINLLNTKCTICDNCKEQYYKYYRTECRFTFSIKNYEFMFSDKEKNILSVHGMYSASNRGGNIFGVSRDHMFSVKDGHLIGLKPFVLSHPANCKLLLQSDNSKKNSRSSITLKELYKKIIEIEDIKPCLTEEQLNYIYERLAESG